MWLRPACASKTIRMRADPLHVIPVEAFCIQQDSRERSAMCPFCLATVGLVVAGAVSTGGLATPALKVFRKRNHAAETASNAEEKEK
jgi:hypothetical protein